MPSPTTSPWSKGGRLFSAYGLGSDRFWVITDAERTQTTVLLQSD
jgi:hypothetical protein